MSDLQVNVVNVAPLRVICFNGFGESPESQALGKLLQTGQATLRGFLGKHALGVQAGTQAHGFLAVEVPAVTAVAHLANFESETVRPHVDGRQQASGGGQGIGHGPYSLRF